MANIWGISVADATAWHRANSQGWTRDLTQDGDIHPHPGPQLHVVSINAGGLAGTWRAVEEFISVGKVDVLGVQEVAASDSDLLALRRTALKNGYRMFHVAGNPTRDGRGAVRQRGGVALFVRLIFRIRPAISFVGLDSQCVGVWLDGWLLATAYAPPGYKEEPVLELASGLLEWFSTSVPFSQPWLVFGDFNEVVGASKVQIALSAFGGMSVSPDKPTRWEGRRCVDWALTNRPLACDHPELLDVALSDHIPVSLVLNNVGHQVELGSLLRTAQLVCPQGVDHALWEKAIVVNWNDNSEIQNFVTHLETSDAISVQEEWDRFQLLLTCCVLDAYDWLSNVGLLSPEVRSVCSRMARQTVWKGQLAAYKRSSCAQAGVRHQVGELAVRKKRRLLARCFQYKRLMCRSLESQLSAVQVVELVALKKQLGKVFGDNLSLRDVLEHVRAIQGELRRLEESNRNANISNWRRKMIAADAELSRWLKSRSSPIGVSVLDQQGRLAESDVDAAQVVHDYWSGFWNQARARQPSLSDRVASLLAGLPSGAACSWEPPSAQCLRAIAAGGTGSHGPDGWTSREVALLPFEVFKVFAILGKRWMMSGNVPAQFCESKMISLPKPGKVNSLNQISVTNLRPITVMSVWWRIWASAWAKGCLRAWMREHVPRHFAVAHAVSTGEVIVDLLDKLMAGGYLASLDYSKAYDLLDPGVTKALLVHVGWDPSFVEVATKVWLYQERWVSFGAHTHAIRTPVAPAMPQGDPLGPLVMALWTWAGWASVESVCSRADSILTRVFVDDRAFAGARVWDLMERYHAWCAWSVSVGLLENQQKTVVVASTPARRATLRKFWPEHIAINAELLGSCSMVACRRGLMPRELERVTACKRVLSLLACIGLPFECYMRACRSFAVSKVAYGWIARAPPLTLCKSIFTCVHMGSRRLRSASVWLRAAIFGGGLHLDVLFATQLVGVLSRTQRTRDLTWSLVSGTPTRALNDWLCSHGWICDDTWKWSHALSRSVLDFTVRDDVGARQHVIRNAWRAWCLHKHCQSNRQSSRSGS